MQGDNVMSINEEEIFPVNYEGIKELEYAVKHLGMQRCLYELATIINAGKEDVIGMRLRYGSLFNYDLHHYTANDRNEYKGEFKMDSSRKGKLKDES